MSNKNTGGPAFPQPYEHSKEVEKLLEKGLISEKDGLTLIEEMMGLTQRQYAAIKLKVPDSGTDWLDEMILASKRDDLAAQVMQSESIALLGFGTKEIARRAYEMADAVLEAGKQ